ncbi:MAG: class I SAM-dependent methyltransferase [Candidatus Schekmanbacteria bacterium]|nr:class I SAM-dependent methyltransferase [Candidatus Schekmanbacteria bacterium]
MRHYEKILPTQHHGMFLYEGEHEKFVEKLYEFSKNHGSIEEPENIFRLHPCDDIDHVFISSNPVQIRFLCFLMRIANARRVLEVGTCIGISTMFFARELLSRGDSVSSLHVTTIEKYHRFSDIAEVNFRSNRLDNIIELVRGDAGYYLSSLDATVKFDFVYIDGGKENYAEYFRSVYSHLTIGGLIIVDDVFFHGDVLNSTPSSPKSSGVLECLSISDSLEGCYKCLIPICNGMLLVLKLRETDAAS